MVFPPLCSHMHVYVPVENTVSKIVSCDFQNSRYHIICNSVQLAFLTQQDVCRYNCVCAEIHLILKIAA